MSKTTDPLAWTALAEEDYLLARSALRRKRPLRYGACFHAQQCAEKYLKALLVFRGHVFPRTHDLLALSDLCTLAGVIVPIAPDELDRLSACAVQVRYPGDEPTLEEARRAMEIAKAVRRFARKFLGLH
ncbi:MAG: HEPN domain-containing protein [Chloroflexi bacterium]|nr:HEPN domain-containing protein [Chloroflexota bacterium]MBL7065846.1 HEPN domain-containing protein [Anaerolineae bacterium]